MNIAALCTYNIHYCGCPTFERRCCEKSTNCEKMVTRPLTVIVFKLVSSEILRKLKNEWAPLHRKCNKISKQLFWVATTVYQASSAVEKLLYNLTLKLEKLRIQLRKEIVRVGGVCSKTNANHPTWLSHVMLASPVPTLASIFPSTWSLAHQNSSSTIKGTVSRDFRLRYRWHWWQICHRYQQH